MEKQEFVSVRKKLGRTQKQLASLLGASLKAVQGYEQGWRKIPVHIERQLFFLIYLASAGSTRQKSCWVIHKCPTDRRDKCPAWEFKAGEICWFINGTSWKGIEQKNWQEKMKICHACEILISLLEF